MSGTAVGQVNTAKRGWVKKLGATFVVLAIFWVAGCALIYREMRKPPEQFGNFMKRIPAPVAFLAFPFESMWMKARAGTVNVGDRAPDFTLQALDGNASHSQIDPSKSVASTSRDFAVRWPDDKVARSPDQFCASVSLW